VERLSLSSDSLFQLRRTFHSIKKSSITENRQNVALATFSLYQLSFSGIVNEKYLDFGPPAQSKRSNLKLNYQLKAFFHITTQNATPFVPIPFSLNVLHVCIVEAIDLHSSTLELSPSYFCGVKLSSDTIFQETRELENTFTLQ
jgi:ankyrin repeat protein